MLFFPSNKLTYILLLMFLSLVAYADIAMTSTNSITNPTIDGIEDELWKKIPPTLVKDIIFDTDITLKSIHSDDTIYFLVSYDDKMKNDKHRVLLWDSDKKRYLSGYEREDTFVIKWNMSPYKTNLTLSENMPYTADIWFWKANRTNPSGYADDKMHIYSNKSSKKAKMLIAKDGGIFYLIRKGDSGRPAYYSNLYSEYEKDKMPQYSSQTPSGSRADIKAKGRWENGRWTIEFSRKLNTGNPDDQQLKIGSSYFFATSITEIAGRDPEPESENPMYGTGEVGELIYITIQK